MDKWGLAVVYAALADRDAAIRWLEAARQARFSWMPWNNESAVPSQDLFYNLRGDPRFADLTRRVAAEARH